MVEAEKEKLLRTERLKAFVFEKMSAFDGLPVEDAEAILGMLLATLLHQHPREELYARALYFIKQVIRNVEESPWDEPTEH